MDLRRWLLNNQLPNVEDLRRRVSHIPDSGIRSESVMKLFLHGYHTRFKLTMKSGCPTESLRLLASLIGAGLYSFRGLPEDEQKAFSRGTEDQWVAKPGLWYLRGITDRVKKIPRMPVGAGEWILGILPGLMRREIQEWDHKKGKFCRRVRYLALCPPDWRLSHGVYEGVHRWNYEHWYFRGTRPCYPDDPEVA